MATMTVSEAIARLERLLPVHEPELWESLQPPATENELEALREAVAPFDAPPELIELLSWRNGGPWGGPWWPVVDCGHLLGAAEAADHYRWLFENTEEWQWHRSWLPIAHEGWNQCGIELAADQRGLIVDGSFPDPPMRLAPSLAALLHATCATIEAGVPSRPEDSTGPKFQTWLARRSDVVEATYKSYGNWLRMSIHADALMRELRNKLSEHPRISLLLIPSVTTVNREEHISFYWLDRHESVAAETVVRSNDYVGQRPEAAAETIVGGLFA